MTPVVCIATRGRTEAHGETVPISQIPVPGTEGLTKPASLVVLTAHPALHSQQESAWRRPSESILVGVETPAHLESQIQGTPLPEGVRQLVVRVIPCGATR